MCQVLGYSGKKKKKKKTGKAFAVTEIVVKEGKEILSQL